MNTKIIKLDINKNLYDILVAKQGDTKSRFLLFNLLDGSIPFSLENRSVRVYAIKPDKTEVFNDLIITDATKGYCVLELTTQMLAVSGTVKLELMVIEGDKKLTSNIFYMDVKESINSEKAVVSTNEFGSLLTALASLNEYDNYKNEIKNARGGEANLNARLNNFNEQLDTKANKVELEIEKARIDLLTKVESGQTEGNTELLDIRVDINGKTYDTAGNSVREQINLVNNKVDELKIKDYKNLCDINNIEDGYYWAVSLNKVIKTTATNVGVVPKIKLKTNTTYYLRRITTGHCYLCQEDTTLISKLNAYSTYEEETRGTETIIKITTLEDCYLCMTYATNLNYSTAMIVEGELPNKFYSYNTVYKKTIDGLPIGNKINYIDVVIGRDYTTIQEALKFVVDGDYYNQTNIILPDGTYEIPNELVLPDYCNIIGQSGNRDKCIIKYIPTSPSDYDVTTYSGIRMDMNSKIKNITLITGNCRYSIHSDSSNVYQNWTQELENCIIQHNGNTTGNWTTQNPWGGGASSGCTVIAKECIFIAKASNSFAFSVHNNTNFEKPFRHYFKKCEFISEKYGSFKCEGLESGTDDIVFAENCYFSSAIYMTNSLSIKMILSGCNLVQCNSTNYFENNSVAIYRENTKYLKNNTADVITKGTLVCYDGEFTKVRPMLSTDSADIFAGFVVGDTNAGELCTVVTNGYYRYTTDLTFGKKYGVDNGQLSETASNKIGICSGGGFVKIKSNNS